MPLRYTWIGDDKHHHKEAEADSLRYSCCRPHRNLIGFKTIVGPDRSLLTALCMTSITITTVGYGDVIGLDSPYAKLFTRLYVFLATGTILHLLTTLSAYVVEAELKRRRARTKDHFIVRGMGMVGLYTVHELYHTKRPQIIEDVDDSNIER
ncbi:MAG TPA: hypothetical protein DCR97_13750 [Deltaproteobacteria bacterium]|nr:hypothetical protein [Deltaproteobacteria bacterium]